MISKYNIERAFVRLIEQIEGLPADVKVHRGHDFTERQGRIVVVNARNGIEEPGGSGNRVWTVEVAVTSTAVDSDMDDGSDLNPIANIEDLAETVFNALEIGDPDTADDPVGLASRLNSQMPGLGIYHPIFETSVDPELDGNSFVDARAYRVFC